MKKFRMVVPKKFTRLGSTRVAFVFVAAAVVYFDSV
jgi:hypothetical protein